MPNELQVDLNTEMPYVQQRIADYITDLLGIGFSGIRLDAAKHIQPDDLVAIFSKLKANLGGTLPADFIVCQRSSCRSSSTIAHH